MSLGTVTLVPDPTCMSEYTTLVHVHTNLEERYKALKLQTGRGSHVTFDLKCTNVLSHYNSTLNVIIISQVANFI